MIVKIGDKFGRWTVISDYTRHKDRFFKYKCKCECGNIAEVFEDHLRNGRSLSCGCLREERIKAKSETSLIKTKQYRAWYHMKTRCNNAKYSLYRRYGGRGVTYDIRWEKFELFWEDMKDTYQEGLSLDRIDNDKGYYKENCRWATKKEQARNKGNSRFIDTPNGRMTLAEASEITGLDHKTIAYRVNSNWPVERIFENAPHLHIRS